MISKTAESIGAIEAQIWIYEHIAVLSDQKSTQIQSKQESYFYKTQEDVLMVAEKNNQYGDKSDD